MKKYILVCISLIICMMLCSCAKSEKATVADEMIQTIGEVTLSSEEKIIEAENYVDELSEKELKQVEFYEDLIDARTKYDDLLFEESASKIDTVIESIGEVTLDSGVAIAKARNSYDECESNVQEKVKIYATLEKAEEDFISLRATNVESLIIDIGSVNLESGEKIDIAKLAFDELNDVEKTFVTNSDKLTQAISDYTNKRIDNVKTLIDAIGEVTIEKEEDIITAKEAYDNLTAEEKEGISNSVLLDEASNKIDLLIEEKVKADLDKLSKNFEERYDEFQGATFYNHNETPQYINTRSYFLPYIYKDNANTGINIFANYTGDNWIFYKKLIILIDDEKYEKGFGSFGTVRDNDHGDVWEYGEYSATNNDIDILWKIVESESTKIRFEGDQYHYDLTISESDKKIIKETLEFYNLLNS